MFKIIFILFVSAIIVITINGSYLKNDSPIIGIFTQPSNSSSSACRGNCEYIAASYVKFIESAGARVVPVSYFSSTKSVNQYLKTLNGWFFPGGASTVPPSALHLYQRIMKLNEAGQITPLWGTCLGFEWILCIASKNVSILDQGFDSWNISMPLVLTQKSVQSSLFSKAPRTVIENLVQLNVTFNNHHAGITLGHFKESEALMADYDVLSVNKDRQGVWFVSSIESKRFPIFGVQWHPEKNLFEWARNSDGTFFEAIDHSFNAMLTSQYFANFFVNKCRYNGNRFESQAEEEAALIYNYPKHKTGPDFVESYFFHFDQEA